MAYLKALSTFGGEYIYDLAFVNETKTLFMQASAPTGWIKLTAHNDTALRIVNGESTVGTGGTQSFSTIFNASVEVEGTISSVGVSGTIVETSNASLTPSASVTVNPTTITSTQMPVHNHSASDAGHTHTYQDEYS